MAANQSRPVPQETIEYDRQSLLALRDLRDYAPGNPALQVEAVSVLEAQLRQAEETEFRAKKALDAARNARITAGWELHNTMLSVKATVVGQYGANSDAVQSLGLKKKADYRRRARRHNGTSS